MKRYLLRCLMLLLCLALIAPAAHAEDCFTIDIDLLDLDRLNSDDYVARELSASTQGVRVRKYLSDSSELATPVRLTLTDMNAGSLLFDKNYGYQSRTFDSGVIYLPYAGGRATPYLVTLYVGDYVYAMPFMHLQRRLTDNSACTAGARLRELDASVSGDWLMGTVVDLDRLEDRGGMTVDVCASNSYVIGTAELSMRDDALRVEVFFEPSANVQVSRQTLYVALDGEALDHADSYGLGQWIDVDDHDTALIYLPMQVSYDPAGLRSFAYAPGDQASLWQQQDWRDSPDDSWDDDWDGGWDADYGWDDGWSSDADGWE